MQNDNAVSVLNGLIETCKDGEQGFRTAAEGLQDPAIRARFETYARERGQLMSELQAEVRRLGGDPENSGSMSAALHRGWMDIKAAVTGKDDNMILAEAERGEDVAKAAFEKALKEQLPSSTFTLVQQHAAKVIRAHDEVRDLRDRKKIAH